MGAFSLTKILTNSRVTVLEQKNVSVQLDTIQ